MIYFDNAATSFPKAPGVAEEVYRCICHVGASPGRGGHPMAGEANRVVFECREHLAELFGSSNPERIVFTQNCTDSLNTALKGLLCRGDRVIVTSMEHNSMVRPLKRLEKAGIRTTVVRANEKGEVTVAEIEREITPDTVMIACIHASNVCGTVLPISAIGALARRRGLMFLVDAAQSAGIVPIDVRRDHIDVLCFPGHKGLLGPQGTGGLYIREGLTVRALREGGTGSNSESDLQPLFLPDKLESGTLNLPGIAGLSKGVEFLLREGEELRARETEQTKLLLEGLLSIRGVSVIGKTEYENRVGVISVTVRDLDSVECAERLGREFSVAVRGGLHCAPWAHRSLGTLTTGTVRFGVSPFTTREEVEKALLAVKRLAGA